MKNIFKRNKLKLIIICTALLSIGAGIYLGITNRFEYIINFDWINLYHDLVKLEKWLLAIPLLSLAATIIKIIQAVFSHITSSSIDKRTKKIFKNTECIPDLMDSVESLNKKLNIDPRDVANLLKELPVNTGKENTKTTLQQWYDDRRISAEMKEHLLVSVESIFEHIEKAKRDIAIQKNTGQTQVAETLERISNCMEKGNVSEIKDLYFSFKNKHDQTKISVLKHAVNAAESYFAINEAISLYDELITLETNGVNYFNYAKFLQKIYYLNDAAKIYKKALKVFWESYKENLPTYLAVEASILNNLAIIQTEQNKLNESIENYKKALKSYRLLAKEDPQYISYIANVLKNTGNLQLKLKEYKVAKENYQEAFSIFKELSLKEPEKYLPKVAFTTCNIAIWHLDKKNYSEAIKKYQEVIDIYDDEIIKKEKKYLPDKARSLQELSFAYLLSNDFSQAFNTFQEAISIFKRFDENTLRKHELIYAKILVMGVQFFLVDKRNLEISKEILCKYPEKQSSQALLKIIYQIKKTQSVT